MPPLQGVGVLVTRPELQAMPLCRLLAAQGASTLRLPALEIRPTKDRRALAEQLGALHDFDVIIFTSANAVRFGVSFLDQKRDLTLAAIGPATARAINQSGLSRRHQPKRCLDTESMLAHPKLAHVSGHRILVIKGSDGRQLLQQELTRRGATVASVNVYERRPTRPTEAALAHVLERFAAGEMHAVTATSVKTGEALLNVAPAGAARGIRARALVGAGRARGFGIARVGAAGAVAAGSIGRGSRLVAALIRWRSSVSGA